VGLLSGFLGILGQMKGWPLAAKLSCGVIFVALTLFVLRRARKSQLRRLWIRNPDELKITVKEFRGRGDDLKRIIRLLEANKLVCLTGESGCGKTTLIEWGLLTSPELISAFHIVKLDSYGTDWIRGPVLALTAKLAASDLTPSRFITTNQSDLSHLLSDLQQRIDASELPILLILDQFDDYLATFHASLRRDAQPIDSSALIELNPFWSCLLTRPNVTILFVVDPLALLWVHPFIGNVTPYNLESLARGHARDLLEILLARAGSAIDEPELGRLVDEITAELERRKLLPVQLAFTLRGLPYLRAPTLKAFQEAGKLPGLIGLGIQYDLDAVTTALNMRYPTLAIRYSTLLDTLLLLANDAEADAQEPRTKSTQQLLSEIQGGYSLEMLESALDDLDRRRIVRRQFDEKGAIKWTLYHKFLLSVLRGLSVAEQREATVVHEAFEAFESSSSWRAKIGCLLPPWVAFGSLLRLRGRVGAALTFLLLSLLLYPLLIGFSLAAIGSLRHLRQVERRGLEIAERFDSSSTLGTPEDIKAIWMLSQASGPIKRSTLDALFDSETNSARFASHGDVIMQAIAGLEPSAVLADLNSVWRERCLDEVQNLEENRLLACALLENELPSADLTTWEHYLKANLYAQRPELILHLFKRLKPADQDIAILFVRQSIESNEYALLAGAGLSGMLLGLVPPDIRDKHLDHLLAGLGRDLYGLRAFRAAMPAELLPMVAERLDSAASRVLEAKIAKGDHLRWAEDISDLLGEGWLFGRDTRSRASAELVESLRGNISTEERLSLIRHLRPLKMDLTPEQIAMTQGAVGSILRDCRGADDWELAAISWLFDRLDRDTARILFDHLGRRQEQWRRDFQMAMWDQDEAKRVRLSLGLGDLALNLEEREREKMTRLWWERLRATDDLFVASPLLLLLACVDMEGDLHQEELVAEVERLIKRMGSEAASEREQTWLTFQSLPVIVRELWPHLHAGARRQLAGVLEVFYLQMICGRADPTDLRNLARVMEEEGIQPPASDSLLTLRQLLDRTLLPCDAMSPLLQKETLGLFVEAFRYPVCRAGMSTEVMGKVVRLGFGDFDEVVWNHGEIHVVERDKLASWARRHGYKSATPLKVGVVFN